MRVVRLACLAVLLARAAPASAQYAEIPHPLPLPADPQNLRAAVQIGRRLFLGGFFTSIAPPRGGAAVVDAAGAAVPGGFPFVVGSASSVVADGAGGWLVAGDFSSIGGRPIRRFARVTPERTVDPRYQVAANGAILHVAAAHGRIYLAGSFTAINGVPRRGLAALDGATGQLSGWGASFDPGPGAVTTMSVSSIGVYVSRPPLTYPGAGALFGLDAASGRVMFTRAVTARSLAASSARVYVGGDGYQRPVWAIDPLTGVDDPWAIGTTFLPLNSSWGEYTLASAMLLDGGRLYIGGNLQPASGGRDAMAVDAATGAVTPFRRTVGNGTTTALARVGPALVMVDGTRQPFALHPDTGALLPFLTTPSSGVAAVAAAPGGAVFAGALSGPGVPRAGVAAVDLDTFGLSSWTTAFPLPWIEFVQDLATDGAWLFVLTTWGRLAKIDPATGAVAGEMTLSGSSPVMRVHGQQLFVSTYDSAGGARLGRVDIATFTYAPYFLSFGGYDVMDMAFDGDIAYLAGNFTSVNGADRPNLAAIRIATGEVLPWRPAPDDAWALQVEAAAGRVWVSGAFRFVGGARRRGLAELDPVTGAALPWNPDAVGVHGVEPRSDQEIVGALRMGPDGRLYAQLGNANGGGRPTAGGQAVDGVIAFDPATGRRVPWQHGERRLLGITPDCLVATGGCLPRSLAAPSAVRVTQAAGLTELSWTLPSPSASLTGVRLELGTREGLADLLTVDLPATATQVSAPAPPGRYVARVRGLTLDRATPPSADVSFAVGAPAAPLDVTAVVDGTRVTLQWLPPSTGAPPAYLLEAGTREGLRDLASVWLPGGATAFSAVVPPATYWARLRSVDATGQSAPGGELLLYADASAVCRSAPASPTNLAATVAGGVVTLTWQLVGGGVQPDVVRVVAGRTPGARDVTIDLGPAATSFSTPAPPGTYYVSLTAANGCGASAASAPVTIVVP